MVSVSDVDLMYLDAIFRKSSTNREKHLKATPILQRLGRDKNFVQTAINSRLAGPDFWVTESCTVDVEIPVLNSNSYSLFLNFFSPSEIHGNDIAFTSVHHHDDVRLTSVCVRGGYEFACFEPARSCTSPFRLKLREFGRHREGGVISVEPFQPHVVFYPKDVTCTLALWSNEGEECDFDFGRVDTLSDFDLRQTWEDVSDTNQLKIVKDNCFLFFDSGVVYSERMALPPVGENFIENYLFRAQRLGFMDKNFIARWWQMRAPQVENRAKIYVERILRGYNIDLHENSYHRRNMYMHPSRDKILAFCS